MHQVKVKLASFGTLPSGTHNLVNLYPVLFKGELQRQNKLISYERVFKMLENDMYITGIRQAVLKLLNFEVGSWNYQRGISLLKKFLEIFGNMLEARFTENHVTSDMPQFPNIKN